MPTLLSSSKPWPRRGRMSLAAAMCVLLPTLTARAAPVARDGGALTFDRTGAQVHEQLPDLTLYTLDGKPASFHQAWDGVVITVSLTCPKSRAKYPDARALADQLKGKTRVSLLYVIEAHPDQDPWPYKNIVDVTPENRRDGILKRQPTTLEERLTLARGFRDRFDVPKEIEIYVDGMQNRAWQSVGGGPNMGLVIDRNGVVRARQGWFDVETLKPAAEEFASGARGGERGVFIVAGPSALQEALLHNQGELAKRLLAAGERTNFFSAAALGDVSDLRRMLDADPAIALRRDGRGRSPLDYAAATGRLDVVKLLLDYGATDQRAPGNAQATALHWAARFARLDVARVLLDEAGADVKAKDADGRTPLDRAEEAARDKSAPASAAAAATHDLLKEAWDKPVKPAAVRAPKRAAESQVPVP